MGCLGVTFASKLAAVVVTREGAQISMPTDDHLPKDPDRFFEKTVLALQKEMGYKFRYRVTNLQYIKRLLRGVDDQDV